jgi:hypothetical protein
METKTKTVGTHIRDPALVPRWESRTQEQSLPAAGGKTKTLRGTSTQPKKIEQEGQDGGRKDSNGNSRREYQTEHEKNDLGHQKLKHNSDLERPTKEINEQHKNVRQQLISVLKSNKIHTNNRCHRPSTLI